jgi:hypothetical protein
LLRATRTVPIVFLNIPDPFAAGLVDSFARPSGNATGFALYEYDTSAKLLDLLKEIAPHVTRAAVIQDAAIVSAAGQFGAIQTAGPSLGDDRLNPATSLSSRSGGRPIRFFARSRMRSIRLELGDSNYLRHGVHRGRPSAATAAAADPKNFFRMNQNIRPLACH